MKTAIVTGAFGFLGRYVSKAAADAGYSVVGIGHGSWGREEFREWGIVDWHSAEISTDSLNTYGSEADVIFHCAGGASVAFSMAQPAEDHKRSVSSALAVLEFLRTSRPQAKLVIPSSASVYGLVERMPISVNAKQQPASMYGVNKKSVEDLCFAYAKYFGLKVALIRFFSIYGAGLRKQLLWDACRKFSEGSPVFFGSGNETRDWIHVSDAAELMLLAAEKAEATCPIVNGGSGVGTTIKDVIDVLSIELKADKYRFSGEGRRGDPVNYVADITEARAWGWSPRKELTQGLKEYVSWFAVEEK